MKLTDHTLPAQRMSVTGDQVHLWHASLDRSSSEMARLESHLASDEVLRAARFRQANHRRRFITCRGLLREILAAYVGGAPSDVEFVYGEYGKPRLKVSHGTHSLRFNVSHSCGLAVFAIAHDREIGVDVEGLQSDFAWGEVARSFFSAQEVLALHALPTEQQYEAFLNAWTCKEAYTKARGDGLSLPSEQMAGLPSLDESYFLYPTDNTRKNLGWTLQRFAPSAGFVGALAIGGTDPQLACGQWQR